MNSSKIKYQLLNYNKKQFKGSYFIGGLVLKGKIDSINQVRANLQKLFK